MYGNCFFLLGPIRTVRLIASYREGRDVFGLFAWCSDGVEAFFYSAEHAKPQLAQRWFRGGKAAVLSVAFIFSVINITTMVAFTAPVSCSYRRCFSNRNNPLIPNAADYLLPSRKVIIQSSAHSGTVVYDQSKQNRSQIRIMIIIGGLIFRP